MAYEDWTSLSDDEEDELLDSSPDARRDVILFAIDCSASMHDPNYEDGAVKTSHLLAALDAAMQIQKRKVVVGPNDKIGVLLFNTVRRFFIVIFSYANANCR